MNNDESKFASRRRLLSLSGAGGALAMLPQTTQAQAPPQDAQTLNVRSFGAKGDATADDSAAFQKALDAASRSANPTVYAPPGRYLFRGTLSVPDGVTLRGSYACVPSHIGFRNAGQPRPGDHGTALLVTAGGGKEDGTPFITLNTNSSATGLSIYYPEQVMDKEPIPYPWTVVMRGKNPAIFEVELLNPYQGIDASRNERHNVRNITGQPLRRGILVDSIYDIGRIENVHFNPWWSGRKRVYDWQTENGEAFIFGRADWEYVLNTFAFGYHVGYKFMKSATGVCNGNFLGIGADDCNRAVLVEDSAPYGILITNGEFTSFHGSDPTMIDVLPTNRGVVRISNSAFWGPCNQVAKIAGRGTVGFSDCTFVQWGGKEGGRAAIQATSGNVLIRGCDFRQNKEHIALGEGARAVITGNIFTGPAQIQNASGSKSEIGLNLAG